MRVLTAAALALLAHPLPRELTRAKVPGREVEVTLELSGFQAEPPDEPARTLLFGSLGDGVFLSGASCVARRAKEARFKTYAEAAPWLERLLARTEDDDSEALRRLRPSAQFNLASCYARTNQPDKAMASLRAALAAEPEMKKDAAESELLASLRSRKDFKELVGP
jgi:tetratricopeptide (TPR) repeat protein